MLERIGNLFLFFCKLFVEEKTTTALIYSLDILAFWVPLFAGIYGLIKYILLIKDCCETYVISKDMVKFADEDAYEKSNKDKAKLNFLKAQFCKKIEEQQSKLPTVKNDNERLLHETYQNIKSTVANIPTFEELDYFKWYYNKGELRTEEEEKKEREKLEKKLYKKKYGYIHVFDEELYEDSLQQACLYLTLFLIPLVDIILGILSMNGGTMLCCFEYFVIFVFSSVPIFLVTYGISCFAMYIARFRVKRAYQNIGEKPPLDLKLISTATTAGIAAFGMIRMFKGNKKNK